jgi:predicted HicB family RNase H-like nuclease
MATVYVRDFPKDLHKRAKMKALEEDMTLRELIIKAVENYLKKKGVK